MPFLVFAEKKNDKNSLDFQGLVGIDLFNTCLENPGSSQPLQFVNFHQLEGGPKNQQNNHCQTKMVRIPMVFQACFQESFWDKNPIKLRQQLKGKDGIPGGPSPFASCITVSPGLSRLVEVLS